MIEQNFFTGHFLVAMPSLNDINFSRAVIYVEEHSEEGAIGIVVNKPLHLSLGNVLNHLNITITSDATANQAVYMGGPVGQDQGFVLHPPWPKPDNTDEKICISSSKEILRLIATGQGPSNFIITLGYSGWEPGQLEIEIARNAWLVVPGDPNIIFDTPIDNRWSAAAKILGIDVNQLSEQSGHA